MPPEQHEHNQMAPDHSLAGLPSSPAGAGKGHVHVMYQSQSPAESAATLEDYLRAIRARLWIVLAGLLLGLLLAALYLASQTSAYTAEARVQLGPTPVGADTANRLQSPNLELEREVLASNQLASEVASVTGSDGARDLLDALDVKFTPDSDVLRIFFTDTDSDRAAVVANAFAASYVSAREGDAEAYYSELLAQIESQIAAVDEELAASEARIDELSTDLAEASALSSADPTREVLIATATQDRNTERSTQNQLLAERRTLRSELASAQRNFETRSPAASLLREAAEPQAPDGVPRNWIYLGLGLVGLLAGTALALVLDRLDSTARDESAVTESLGARVLGAVTRQGWRRLAGEDRLVMLSPSKRVSQARESFRRIRSSLQFLATTDGGRVFLFTSAYPSEGKTFTVVNTALALAQTGNRTAIVSADLRRPGLDNLLDLPRDSGLSTALGSSEDVDLVAVDGVDNLWVLPAGPLPSNPAELLSLDTFGQLLDDLRQTVDFVLVDTPPVLLTADAATAARHVDGVVVVVDSHQTETVDLMSVRSDLERAGAKVVGAVMNRVRRRRNLFGRDRYGDYS